MIHFWHRIAETKIVMVNTVHDSIVSELPPEEQERFERICVQSMTYDVRRFLSEVYEYEFVTPLGVGVKVAEHWGDTKREKVYNVFSDGRFTVKEKN